MAEPPLDDDRTLITSSGLTGRGTGSPRSENVEDGVPVPDDDGATQVNTATPIPPAPTTAEPTAINGTPAASGATAPPQDAVATEVNTGGATRPAASTAAPTATTGGESITIQPGSILGHTYEIEAVVARGGMGRVYRARHVELGTAHAIKVILPEYAADPAVVELFRREASVLRQVRHDAVVAYDGINRDAHSRLYLVMEFVEGPSLGRILRDGPLSEEDGITLLERMAAGLSAAHAKGVVHRDLSPDNIILPGAQVAAAKIIDFGISKQLANEAGTIIGDAFAGKYSYASPEQFGMYGGSVDARSDIYSIGLVLVEAVRGKRLDMGANPSTAIQARMAAPDLSDLPPRIRPALAAMLAPDPKDRPTNFAGILERLPKAATLLPAPPSANDQREERPGKTGGMPVGKIAAAAVVALAVAGGAFVALKPSESTQQAQAPQPPVTPTVQPTQPAATAAASTAGPAAPPAVPANTPSSTAAAPTTPAAAAEPAPTPPATPAVATPTAPPPPQAAAVVAEPPPAPTPTTPTAPANTEPPRAEPARPETAAAQPQLLTPPRTEPPAAQPDPTPSPASPTVTQAPQPAPQPAPPPTPVPEQVAVVRPPSLEDVRAAAKDVNRNVACSGVDVRETSGGYLLAGYAGSEADAATLRDRIGRLPVSAKLTPQIAVRPWPFCDLLSTVQPVSAEAVPMSDRIRIEMNRPSLVYRDGEVLTLTVKAGARGGFLTVDYYDLEGNAVHMLPMPLRRNDKLAAGGSLTLGADHASATTEERVYTISPPYGPGMIVAVLTQSPLFRSDRAEVEPVRDYVGSFRGALSRAQGAGQVVAAHSVFFETRGR